MVATLFASVPALLNVGAMLFLLFFLYAIIGARLRPGAGPGLGLGWEGEGVRARLSHN